MHSRPRFLITHTRIQKFKRSSRAGDGRRSYKMRGRKGQRSPALEELQQSNQDALEYVPTTAESPLHEECTARRACYGSEDASVQCGQSAAGHNILFVLVNVQFRRQRMLYSLNFCS